MGPPEVVVLRTKAFEVRVKGRHAPKPCNWRSRGNPLKSVAFRLQDLVREVHVKAGAAVILTVTLCTAAGWLHGSSSRHHARRAVSGVPLPVSATVIDSTPARDTSGWSSLPTPLIELPDPQAGPAQDLYGNDVSDAIAKYKLDRLGSVYEEHSPNTEVPRLKPPTT
jgi:hypothetical protein